MSFLTIRLEYQDLDFKLDANRAYAIRKALASLLELELRRDFQSVNVTLHDPEGGPELVAALRSPHDLTKLTEQEQQFLDHLNTMLEDSPYRLDASGAAVRKDTGQDVPGVGCDWRAAMRAVHQQGGGIVPGIVASIIDGAEEVERRQQGG
jgi:hypothetical protein